MENPVVTATGDIVTSPSDTFWSRMQRIGRLYQGNVSKSALSTSGAYTQFGGVSAESGYLFYPQLCILTADAAVELALSVTPGTLAGNGTANTPTLGGVGTIAPFYNAFVAAGTPFVIQFNGDVFIDGDVTSSKLSFQAKTTTAGNGYAFVMGYEVSKQYA